MNASLRRWPTFAVPTPERQTCKIFKESGAKKPQFFFAPVAAFSLGGPDFLVFTLQVVRFSKKIGTLCATLSVRSAFSLRASGRRRQSLFADRTELRLTQSVRALRPLHRQAIGPFQASFLAPLLEWYRLRSAFLGDGGAATPNLKEQSHSLPCLVSGAPSPSPIVTNFGIEGLNLHAQLFRQIVPAVLRQHFPHPVEGVRG